MSIKTKTIHTATRPQNQDLETIVIIGEKEYKVSGLTFARGKINIIVCEEESD